MSVDKKRTAIAAGHICLDLTPKFDGNIGSGAKNIGDILAPGKLIKTGDVDIHTGGSVANTGLAMKILGADVKLMGKVGRDDFGDTVKRILDQYEAGGGLIVSDDSSTSYSVVLALPGFDRVFLHNPGANDTFSYDDIDWEAVDSASLFHFGYPPLMARLYENSGSELIKILSRAKQSGTVTSLDMAAVDPSSDAGGADWEEILRSVLPYVDFFVPSVEELCYMLDRRLYDEWVKRAAGGDMIKIIKQDEVKALAKKALNLGARLVLLKCGSVGMYFCSKDEGQMKDICSMLGLSACDWSDKEGFEKCYIPERIVSATGAGDTSIAAFLTAALFGEPLEEAVHLAAATGACCVEAYDALSGLRPFDELKQKISAGWKKQT